VKFSSWLKTLGAGIDYRCEDNCRPQTLRDSQEKQQKALTFRGEKDRL
jgi:hypothetical protein